MSKENYIRISENIAKIAISCGRRQEDITLIAVSKERSLDDVKALYDVGCLNFGENRIPDALLKIENSAQEINWHFIGSLQKNKVRKVIENFVLIHSVDSVDLAIKISECSVELNKVTRLLLQVNTSLEKTKHGFTEEALVASFEKLTSLPSIKIEGLMTMAPLTDDKQIIRDCFSRLRKLKVKLNLKELSMGMSQDYEIAIEEGATILRIGSKLF